MTSEGNSFSQSVQPALKQLNYLRTEIKKRGGKEGGNLNERMLAALDTIESTLLQIPSVQAMFNVINQQAQLATMTFRQMGRLAAHGQSSVSNGEDDGTSTTKGE